MNEPSIDLPGLERLLSTCRANNLRVRTWPPEDEASRPRGTLLGQPLDPVLAATFSRFNGGFLGELCVFQNDDASDEGLVPSNRYQREYASPQMQEVLYYAVFNGYPYYLATVPSLADADGVQPVIHVTLDITLVVRPIASSVDRAFDLYARYLDTVFKRYGSVQAAEKSVVFPGHFASLIAKDWRLVQKLERNEFKIFEPVYPDLVEWRARILKAVEGRT